jgi:hypothetical protein
VPAASASPSALAAASTGSASAASAASGAAASAESGVSVAAASASGFGGLGCGRLGCRLLDAALLLDQRRDPVGEVARQRLEQAGHLLHRCGERAGQTGQQHLAGRQFRQRGEVRGREERAVGQSALDHEVRVRPREVAQRLGHRADVALHERQRTRTAQVLPERLVLAAVDCPTHEGVLEDLVVAADRAEGVAEFGELRHG